MGLASTFTNSIVREIGRNYGKEVGEGLFYKVFGKYFKTYFDFGFLSTPWYIAGFSLLILTDNSI